MKKFFKWAGISLFAIVVIGTSLVFGFRARLIARYKPTVEQFGDIHVVIKNDTSYVSSRIIVKNNSFLRIDIDTLKYKIFLFHKKYMENIDAIECELKGYGSDTINFSLKIPYVTLLNDLKAQRETSDSASYEIHVSLKYSTFLGTKEMPISKSAKIKIPQPPELDLVGINYTKIRMKKIQATAEIKLTNHSPVTITISELNYNMNILKQGKLSGKYSVPVDIKSNETTLIYLPIEITVNNLGKTLFQVFMNKDNYDYTITMNAQVTSTDPIKKSFQIDLSKTGKMELKK